MDKHTQRPFLDGKFIISQISKPNGYIFVVEAKTDRGYMYLGEFDRLENAQLYASAPKMLETLKDIKEWSVSRRTINSSSIWNVADEAIKEAEGK